MLVGTSVPTSTLVMNIFYLDRDPKLAAQYHCDKHVVKMILESAQLLSTAHRILDGVEYVDKTASGRRIKRWKLNDHRDGVLYTASHVNHPSGVWARESDANYNWLWLLAKELCVEYRHRYGAEKVHKTSHVLLSLREPPKNISRDRLFSEPPQAMPDDVKVPGNSILAYRNYYRVYKNRFANWKNREVPSWYKYGYE